MIEIVHGGQTGVDRGAHEGATDNGWPIAGYMPKDGCDEDGAIPGAVAQHLRRCTISGYPARTETNLSLAHFVLVIVADKNAPYASPGTRLTLIGARKLGVRRLVIDPRDPVGLVADTIWARWAVGARSQIRVMVAGPRASRWTDGRIVTAALLQRLKIELERTDPRSQKGTSV